MWLSEQKLAMFACKRNLPQLIATLNNYTCSLPPLVNVNWSAVPEYCFSEHINPWLVKWHQWRSPIWQWGTNIISTVCTHLSRHCSRILAFVGACGCQSHSILYITYVILLLCFSLCHHTPHLHTLLAHPLLYTGPIIMNSMKQVDILISKNQALQMIIP